MLDHASQPPSLRETLERARALRNGYARAAAFYANCLDRAEGGTRAPVAARWAAQYRRSSAKYRRLGEFIRGEREAA